MQLSQDIKEIFKPGIVLHICSPSIREPEAGGS